MINVEKKQIKSIEDYRHNIKLLKYHLKKQQKTNERLKYEEAKSRHQTAHPEINQPHKIYSMSDTVKTVSGRLKRMGLILEDVFRMADTYYQGQINREQFMKVIFGLRTNLDDSLFSKLFNEIDTSANNLISQDQFIQFSIAYGGCTNSKQINKFQKATKSKLGNLIQKKHGTVNSFLEKFPEPFSIHDFQKQLRSLGLTQNQNMLMMKTFDPGHQGFVKHQLFRSLMEKVKFKSQSEQKEDEFEKGIQELCAYWRDHKMNPISIFQEADVDGTKGVSVFQLEQAFKKLMPAETNFQIKKWVGMINLNQDSQITKDEFMNSIRSFYSLSQMGKFSDEYTKMHPELAITEEQNIENIMKELSQKIEDSGMTKTETFHFIDFNKNGELSKEQMVEGLKRLGMKVGFAGRVVSVFDRDSSGQVNLKEWLRVLGEDVQVSQVPLPDDLDSFFEQSDQGEKAKVSKKQAAKKQNKKPETKESKKVASQKENKNKTAENKAAVKKESTNKTSKIQKNTKIEQQSKKGVLDKKFKEDEVKKSDKPTQNNKTLKKTTKKPQKKQSIKQKPAPDYNNQSQDQKNDGFDEINTDQIEQKIAINYKKNKSATIKHFQQKDQKKNGQIKMKDFLDLLNQYGRKYGIDISQDVGREIFEKNCVEGEYVEYKNWLSQLAGMYGQQIESEAEKMSIQKNEDPLEHSQNDFGKQEEKNEYDDNGFDEEDQKQKEGFDHNPIIKATIEKNQVKNKRGSNINAFNELLKLSLVDGKKSDGGYKLIDYIDNGSNNIKDIRNKKIAGWNEYKKKSGGKKFEDRSFPATKKSIILDEKSCQIQNITLIKWKHYSELFKNPKLVQGNIEPSDILQGGIGNCYFLCSLACLSEYSNMIERLFQFIDLQNGYFLIWLCLDGQWQLIEIDGYIPVNAHGEPAFTRTAQDELWVILLQKAYAKAYGCYNHIVGGQPYEAIKDLSGAPGFNYYHNKVSINEIWETLLQANKKQYLMSAGTPLSAGQGIKIDGRQQNVTDQGIVLGHAYSILDCQQIEKNRLVQLRNPWGDVEWGGQWSDTQTKKWTKQLKKKLSYEGKENDGIFWMPIQQFYKNFAMTAVNILRPNYYYDSCIQKNIKQIVIKLRSDEFGNGCIMANRADHRHRGVSGEPYPIMAMCGFVCSKEGKILFAIKEKRYKFERQAVVEFKEMEKYPQGSEAITLISVASSSDLTIGYYGDKKIELQVAEDSMKYYEMMAINDEGNQTTQASGPLKCWLSEVQGLGFLALKNISNAPIQIEVTIQSPQNIKLLPPSSKKNKLKISPNQVFLIRGKVINNQAGFNFNQSISIGG